MNTHNAHFDFRPQPGSCCARWVIIVLCLATWRGPIPLVHSHGAVASANEKLTEHLQRFHHGQVATQFFAWHLHVLLPWQKFELATQEDSNNPISDPITEDCVLVTSSVTGELILNLQESQTQTAFADTLLLNAFDDSLLSNTAHRDRDSGSFLGSLLISAPLCAVTGVALC